MITSPSKNNSLICVDEICDRQIEHCLEDSAPVEPRANPLKRNLGGLWLNIRLFFETDKWKHHVTLKVGDSHYTMRMDEIEARWRNRE